MRDSRAPSSMSGVSVAFALVSDPFIAFTSPTTSSLEPSLVASLAPRSRRYLCEAPLLGGWRPTSQPHSSSKDSTSLSDASAVNRRESSTQGRARALHSRPRSFYVGHRLAWTCRGRIAVASEVSVARSRDTPWTLSSRSIDAEKPRHGQQAAARASRARFTRI